MITICTLINIEFINVFWNLFIFFVCSENYETILNTVRYVNLIKLNDIDFMKN